MEENKETASLTEDPESLPYSREPELIFGLVGPVGVDLDYVGEVLGQSLKEVGYEARTLRVTKLMQEVPVGLPLGAAGSIDSFKQRIAYANEVCEILKRKDALAILAVSAIREFRLEEGGSEEEPIAKQAYIIRQLKRPEEINLLRSVYGRQFIQISVHAPQDYRVRRITVKEVQSRRGMITDAEAQLAALALVKQDERESNEGFGQNVRDAFPLADVFIEGPDKVSCKDTLSRFVRALFGDNTASPTRDEYGIYMAKTASLRSSALTRQVGAAIFQKSGEVISVGCNEVPKAGGGTYWSGDKPDGRDFVEGKDPNDEKKEQLFVDLLNRLLKKGHLSNELSSLADAREICDKILHDDESSIKDEEESFSVKESRMMDLLEFGRDIHAEMSAICDAARNGISARGATLFCTTFPCHMCAKHIVAAGISRVVYIEPYPKSYAQELHADAITIEGNGSDGKVAFQRFIGIAPYRYRDLFAKGKRKYPTGVAQKWNADKMRPMIDVLYPSYSKAETYVVKLLEERAKKIKLTK